MAAIYLHGGGDHPEERRGTFGRFVAAASDGRPCRLALIAAAADPAEATASIAWCRELFGGLGLTADQLAPLALGPDAPLCHADLAAARPSGVFVCGGRTPTCHRALCADRGWVDYLEGAGVVYCGSSAGAMLAADVAIIGGWQAARAGSSRQIIVAGAGEGLEQVDIRQGLGLTPLSIDAHASQWGTLSRLIHAVDLGLIPEGLAIDEDTLAVVDGAQVRVFGRGHAYRVFPCDGAVAVSVLTGG